jgi:hypothetical protein
MSMPITITCLEPTAKFLEVCETMVVSAHGCAVRSPMKLAPGLPLQFKGKNGRQTTAHVVDCQPIGHNQPGWKLAARLDVPGNFWGLSSCPDDWMALTDMPGEPVLANPGNNHAGGPKMPMLRALVAEQIGPLQAELAELRERLIQPKQRNKFEVSLSHIPPEVEEKLWMRLREDLGTQALRQTKEQSERVLAAAQSAIELKITEAQEEFRGWVREQAQALEQRVQGLGADVAEDLRKHLHATSDEFDKRASAAAAGLAQRGQEMLESLLQRLGEEREAHRRELEAVQVAAAAESSRLQTQLSELGRRFTELDEAVQRLESGLNTRLMRMSAEVVSGTRTQLESAAESVFEELAARNAKDLGQHLDQASARLKSIGQEVEASLSASAKASVSETLQRFEKTMDDSAQRAVGRWRIALAHNLKSIAGILGEQLRSGGEDESGE